MWARVLPQLDGAGIRYDPSHSAYDGRDYLAETEEWGVTSSTSTPRTS